jgi:hypothetical protein
LLDVHDRGAARDLARADPGAPRLATSCAAADTQPGNEGTLADGQYLMGALAIHTGANVFAATRIQWFHTYKDLDHGRFILNGWSGDLLRFSPTNGRATQVLEKSLTFEFSKVMAGRAR